MVTTTKPASPDMPSATTLDQTSDLRSVRFRRDREATWQELEGLVAKVEKRGIKALAASEALRLAVIYQATISSLSVARAISLDLNTRLYLEELCARAFLCVHGAREPLGTLLMKFLGVDFPRAVRGAWAHLLVATLTMLAGGVAAYMLVIGDPAWFTAFMPEALAGGRTPAASTEQLRETLFDTHGSDELLAFSTYLFVHNAGVAIVAFALGFALGVPTLMLLFYNGLVLGAFFALFDSRGLGIETLGWLSIHGTTELTAVIMAGAAGLMLGDAAAFPKDRSRRQELARAGRRAARLVVGAILMLLVAGFLEGIGRQTIQETETRLMIGGGVFALWLAYFLAGGRLTGGRPARGAARGNGDPEPPR